MKKLAVVTPDWSVPPFIHAFTTTVAGGVSEGDCAGLNVGDHVGDNPAHVAENRARLQACVGADVTLAWLQQTHSDIVIDVHDYNGVIEADGSVTTDKNKACVVMTADCLPVLLCNKEGTKVSALHCGWKGLYQDVIGKTLKEHFSSNEQHENQVVAWLGPAIGQRSYEIDESLYQRFIAVNQDYDRAFVAHRPGHYLFDLYEVARQQLRACGVSDDVIFGGDFDTFSDERFFSHRRNPKSGRIATVIYII